MQTSESLPLAGIDVAILVGGLGTRLRGVVDDVPKPLAPVLGRPFLYYLLDMLSLRGARSVTLCSGYMAGFVEEKTGMEWLGMPIRHSVENEPMGTAGALALARDELQSERVLVLNGDTWLEPDFKALEDTAENSDFCIAGAAVPDASRYGMLEWDASGRLISFSEKNQSGTPGSINAGMYLITQNLLASLPVEPHSLERQVLPGLTFEGRVKVFPTDSPFLDIGTPGDYARAGEFFSDLGIAPHRMFPDNPPMEKAQPKLGTCAVIFDEAGRILLEQRADCGWWCLPGGRLDAGETLAQGTIREAMEETGLEIEITRFLGVFSDPKRRTVRYPDNGDLRQLVDAVCIAHPIGGQLLASNESLNLAWFAPVKLPLNTVPPVVEILRGAFAHGKNAILR